MQTINHSAAPQRILRIAPRLRRIFIGFSRTAMILMSLYSAGAMCQTIDTAVEVDGYRLNFHIVEGTGTPILFESGGGDDATVWRDILAPLAARTNATLITYDRPGFGKSGLDRRRHGILNGLIGLEKALKALGYDGNVMLVAHSFGGFHATLYASRHPEKVKAVVLIDANLACFFIPEYVVATQKSNDATRAAFKDTKPGLYYQFGDFSATVEAMRKTIFPVSVPVVDIVSGKPPFTDLRDAERWKSCHKKFVNDAPNRQGITAYGSGHYVYQDDPSLVLDAIVKAYAKYAE